MTYAPAKFEVATSNGLGGYAFTRKYIIGSWPWGQSHTKHCPVPSTSCDLYTCIVCSCYVKWFRRRCNYKKCYGQTHRRRTDRLWYKINIPYFSNEKEDIINESFTIWNISEFLYLDIFHLKIWKTYNHKHHSFDNGAHFPVQFWDRKINSNK